VLRQTTDVFKKDTFFAHRKSARVSARSKSEDKETSSSSSRDAKVHRRERAERRGERSLRVQKGAKLLRLNFYLLDFFLNNNSSRGGGRVGSEEEEEEERRCSRSRGHRRVAAMLLEV